MVPYRVPRCAHVEADVLRIGTGEASYEHVSVLKSRTCNWVVHSLRMCESSGNMLDSCWMKMACHQIGGTLLYRHDIHSEPLAGCGLARQFLDAAIARPKTKDIQPRGVKEICQQGKKAVRAAALAPSSCKSMVVQTCMSNHVDLACGLAGQTNNTGRFTAGFDADYVARQTQGSLSCCAVTLTVEHIGCMSD